jgi:hypothetical protein
MVAVHQFGSEIKSSEAQEAAMNKISSNVASAETAVAQNSSLKSASEKLQTPEDFKKFVDDNPTPKSQPTKEN